MNKKRENKANRHTHGSSCLGFFCKKERERNKKTKEKKKSKARHKQHKKNDRKDRTKRMLLNEYLKSIYIRT